MGQTTESIMGRKRRRKKPSIFVGGSTSPAPRSATLAIHLSAIVSHSLPSSSKPFVPDTRFASGATPHRVPVFFVFFFFFRRERSRELHPAAAALAPVPAEKRQSIRFFEGD